MTRYFIQLGGTLYSSEDSENGFESESSAQEMAKKYEGAVVVKRYGIKNMDTGKYAWFSAPQ